MLCPTKQSNMFLCGSQLGHGCSVVARKGLGGSPPPPVILLIDFEICLNEVKSVGGDDNYFTGTKISDV